MKTGRTALRPLEQAVVVQMSRGYKPAQIQAALGISKRNYDRLRLRILDKLGASTDMQLGMFVNQQQLVSVDERNRIEDRREKRIDAQRGNGGQSLDQFLASGQ